AADFSCSFLPSAERWHVRDLRDGRVLLSGVPEGSKFCCRDLARDLAVCDPLYRRYTLLPAIPDDLAALAQQSDMGHFEPFLAPPAAEDEEGISFRVICLARCTARLVLLIFSSGSGDGQWRAVTLDNWVSLLAGLDNPAPVIKPESSLWPRMRHYAHGYFCWAFYPANKNKLIMLDTRSMDFSAVNLPPRTRNTQVAILEAGEGRLGLFINEYLTPELRYAVLQNDGGGANQWLSQGRFSLPVNYRYMLVGVAGGYLLIQWIPEPGYCRDPSAEVIDSEVLTLDLRTLQLEWFLTSQFSNIGSHLFAGFPPSLSPPSLQHDVTNASNSDIDAAGR
uniref:DUF1618 domain-containing protein n=2 Tax=Aegilops tauschii subsp. strangulata TaxID=200361 RepID=A0A453ASK2_AEGTS